MLLVELEQQVGSIVACHAAEHGRSLGVGALAQELDLVLVVELLEHVRLELLVLPDRLEDLLPLLVRCGLDQVGDLGRVQPDQPARRHLQARGGHVPDERLDVPPGHELAMLGVVAAEPTWQQPPEPRANARVDAGHAPRAVVVADQVNLVRGDQAGGVDVDQAAIEHVGAEQHLAGAPLELRQVQLAGGRLDRVGPELLDSVDRDEHLPPADASGQADDRGRAVFECGHDVVDLA